MSARQSAVGILYPGELGLVLAQLLIRRGTPVFTTADGRSGATAERAAACGAQLLDSLSDVVRRSDVILSVVVPSAAEEVAGQYCAAAHLAPERALYVDANSIGPATAAGIGRKVEAAGRSFVDASFNGLAKNVAASGTLFLSGPRAAEVGELFAGLVRVHLLGDEAGRASAMKMLLGGLSKGVCALFTELAILASRLGMLDEMLEAARLTYCGVSAVAERMLPTYERHAVRRLFEMAELESTIRAAGVTSPAVDGVVRFHEAMAEWVRDTALPMRDADAAALVTLLARQLENTGVL